MSTTNGREMLKSIGYDGLILNEKNLNHPMCDTRGWTKPTQRDYIVENALQAANKVALDLGLIKKALTMEILSKCQLNYSTLLTWHLERYYVSHLDLMLHWLRGRQR